MRLVPGLGPAPLVVQRAEQGDKKLLAVNRLYSQRFFFAQQGRLAAAGQMAERFFFAPAPDNLYRVVFVGASTVQGFPHPRRLAAAAQASAKGAKAAAAAAAAAARPPASRRARPATSRALKSS